jgi:hypothetical protein
VTAPPKRKGVLLQTPIPKLKSFGTDAPQGWECQHDTKVLHREPQGSQHYGRELCEDCGAFLRWIPKPETVEAREFRAARIARLSMIQKLPEWERGFIKSVAKSRKLSPKQIAIIDRLAADYLEAQT